METRKLYDENAYERSFAALVQSCVPGENGWIVRLDRTAFFPEGGGQRADTGTLGSVRVWDAQEENGAVLHFTDAPLEEGSGVTGVLDWDERFRRMQTHTGEHILSGLLHNRFGYENVGFHLGEAGCTLDTGGELSPEDLAWLETEANRVVWENRTVSARYPAPEELPNLSYRSKLELTENVRLVTIEDLDVCACCAPHVARTGEIGVIKILDAMRHRGGMRLAVCCGSDALRDYQSRFEDTARISRLLNVPQPDIAPAAEKLMAQRDALSYRVTALERKALEAMAASLPPTDGNLLLFTRADEAGMRLLANAGREKCGGICAVFSGPEHDFRFILTSETEDMNAFVRTHREALGLRGGGQARMVSGKCTAGRDALVSFFKGVVCDESE